MEAFAQFVPLILIFAIMYFLLIRPQQRKLKDHKKMLKMVNPEFIIPAHAGHDKAIYIKNLSDSMSVGETILTQNGDHIKVV